MSDSMLIRGGVKSVDSAIYLFVSVGYAVVVVHDDGSINLFVYSAEGFPAKVPGVPCELNSALVLSLLDKLESHAANRPGPHNSERAVCLEVLKGLREEYL